MNYDALKRALENASDPTLISYQLKIVSDSRYPMYYIRMPVLRKIAKKCAAKDVDKLLADAQYTYYEEVLVLGLAVAYETVPLQVKLTKLRQILPKFDSWAMTDCVVPTLRVQDRDKKALWDFAIRCLDDEAEYTRRFGIVIMLNYFLSPEWFSAVEERITALRDERYYVRMAAAWLLAEMAVHDSQRVISLLQQKKLDQFTHNMTIRKMRESFRISSNDKQVVAALRRKE